MKAKVHTESVGFDIGRRARCKAEKTDNERDRPSKVVTSTIGDQVPTNIRDPSFVLSFHQHVSSQWLPFTHHACTSSRAILRTRQNPFHLFLTRRAACRARPETLLLTSASAHHRPGASIPPIPRAAAARRPGALTNPARRQLLRPALRASPGMPRLIYGGARLHPGAGAHQVARGVVLRVGMTTGDAHARKSIAGSV